jgi:long-chain acyl-CoA synthetase
MKKDLKLYSVPDIRSVQDMLLQSAKKYGPKIALEDLNPTPIQQVTYESLLNYVLKFGDALRKLNIKERSHIAVIGENRVQWGITYLSALCFNYVIVPIDKNLNTNEILNIIHESDATVLVLSESYHETFREHSGTLKKLRHYISMDLKAGNDDFLSMTELIAQREHASADMLPDIDPDALAEIIFTSGSLGRAKGVMLTQRNLATNLMAMVSMLFIYPHDKFLSVLPMHHTYECTCGFLCPLYCGASAHYARSLKTIVDDLQKVKATILLGVPLLYDKMFKAIQRGIREKKAVSALIGPMMTVTGMLQKIGWKGAKKTVFKEIHHKFGGSVRIFIAGGAAPDPLVAKGLREFGFSFIQGYGLTETSPILTLNRIDNFKDDAAGLPLPGIELRIHQPDSDGVGEIWTKGPSIMPGYYNNEKATENAFSDGWFRTGDLGYMDADGFLHICGRMKNVIIAKNGKNIFPEEIEDILNRSPFIKESLVSGEKDEKQGEVIAANIVPDAESFIELSEIRDMKITPDLVKQTITEEVTKSNKQLSSYKQIRKIHIRESEFEKTTTQKIKRYVVKKEESVME